MRNLTIYIMAGGLGRRLAPLSTPEKPKPFLNLINQHRTMLQMTIDRVRRLGLPYVITNERYKNITSLQTDSDIAGIVLESRSLNTGYTALQAAQHCNPNNLCLLLPSDHWIDNDDVFLSTIRDAQEKASAAPDALYMFGVPARGPSVEYGYIDQHTGEFHEKPDVNKAKGYIENGYLWNTGMYMFSPRTIIRRYHEKHPGFTLEPYPGSFDKLIVEEYPHRDVTVLDTRWSDLGSFRALYEYFKHYGSGSMHNNHGIGRWSSRECSNCLILNYGDGNPSLYGLENKVVIVTGKDGSKYITCDLNE